MTTIMKSTWNEDAKTGGKVYTRSRKALEGPDIGWENVHVDLVSIEAVYPIETSVLYKQQIDTCKYRCYSREHAFRRQRAVDAQQANQKDQRSYGHRGNGV